MNSDVANNCKNNNDSDYDESDEEKIIVWRDWKDDLYHSILTCCWGPTLASIDIGAAVGIDDF